MVAGATARSPSRVSGAASQVAKRPKLSTADRVRELWGWPHRQACVQACPSSSRNFKYSCAEGLRGWWAAAPATTKKLTPCKSVLVGRWGVSTTTKPCVLMNKCIFPSPFFTTPRNSIRPLLGTPLAWNGRGALLACRSPKRFCVQRRAERKSC